MKLTGKSENNCGPKHQPYRPNKIIQVNSNTGKLRSKSFIRIYLGLHDSLSMVSTPILNTDFHICVNFLRFSSRTRSHWRKIRFQRRSVGSDTRVPITCSKVRGPLAARGKRTSIPGSEVVAPNSLLFSDLGLCLSLLPRHSVRKGTRSEEEVKGMRPSTFQPRRVFLHFHLNLLLRNQTSVANLTSRNSSPTSISSFFLFLRTRTNATNIIPKKYLLHLHHYLHFRLLITRTSAANLVLIN